ncbi:SDR_family oxidoreductase [Hexamita inflata]|uniref:SDR family oxidoreductase n=1 Tax=Hexamita inflata TaxID=28002 RepID=A0AA86RQP1_9EUKA|nr:SDR family oxidoreductase [Hexamita inflata]
MIDNRSYVDQLKAKFGSGPILITGATGSVGFELVRHLCKDFKIIAVGRDLDKLAQLRDDSSRFIAVGCGVCVAVHSALSESGYSRAWFWADAEFF